MKRVITNPELAVVCAILAISSLAMGDTAMTTASASASAGATSAPQTERPQVAVFYFPQWHRTQGDDGEVFAEWKQIKAARPRFEGHEQPKVPLWGYADEADPKAMAIKIDAAADHGVDAFIFDWYYHVSGKYRGTYLEDALNNGYLKAPNNKRVKFCLMWANHGLGVDSPGDTSRTEFEKITPRIIKEYFSHPSYWKIDGKVVFSIYDIDTFIRGMGSLDEAAAALRDFDAQTRAAGLKGIHLNIIDCQLQLHKDAADIAHKLGAESVTSYVWVHRVGFPSFPGNDYGFFVKEYFKRWDTDRDTFGAPYFPNVTMGWDPTPRMAPDAKHDGKTGYPNTPIIVGNTPERFREALEEGRKRALQLPPGRRVVTVNAWNEWGEGSYIEPDTKNGLGYLEAIRSVFGCSPSR